MSAAPPGLAALQFDNAFRRELPGDADTRNAIRQVTGAAWSAVMPTPVRAPRLLAHSPEVARALGLDDGDVATAAFTSVFAGNALVEGMQPIASNYGGHQFGHWAGQLGDGRAISLGEVVAADRSRHELQLKGAGMTPYSRHADGRAVLRSSLREFLCSEAMHHLGVPTTRALSLVLTGEDVVRDMFYDGHPEAEPGAIVCRVAPSFLRFGHLQLPASRAEYGLLRQLVEFSIWRDFPELLGAGGAARPLAALRADGAFDEGVVERWFAEVVRRTATLVAHWQRVGFVHGVLNTDNMSLSGLTIDYGPYGWIEDYDPNWTPNTTDAQGRRYRFGWQPQVAGWNLQQLAQALLPLFTDAAPLQRGLDAYAAAWSQAEAATASAKLGIFDPASALEAMHALQPLMQAARIDMTLFFRALSRVDQQAPATAGFAHCFYDAGLAAVHAEALSGWLGDWAGRVRAGQRDPAARVASMDRANPWIVPRNWIVQEVIDRVMAGENAAIEEALEAFRRPYEDQPAAMRWAARRPAWADERAGCAMLSCSS